MPFVGVSGVFCVFLCVLCVCVFVSVFCVLCVAFVFCIVCQLCVCFVFVCYVADPPSDGVGLNHPAAYASWICQLDFFQFGVGGPDYRRTVGM